MTKDLVIFMDKYKTMEGMLRNKGMDVKEYEETLSQEDSQKLRFCRNIRNYTAHNEDNDNFMSVSPTMIKFIDRICKDISKDDVKVKDMMDKCAVSSLFNIADAARMLDKHPILIVVDDKTKQFMGFFTDKQLRKMISDGKVTKTAKISEYVQKKPKIKINYVNLNAEYASIKDDEDHIVIKESDKSIVGYLYKPHKYARENENI